jgi:hypothetical protein
MTYGFAGSTLVDELNRLANGGADYPARDTYQDAQGAANKWAGTTGLGLNGALNKKAEAGRSAANYKGLNAICNELAGTTGLSAIPALREVED